MCFLPVHVFYLRSRLELVKTLGHIVISPFGPVKFKDFFLADIITSMIPTLRDFIMLIFFFGSGQWYHLEEWAKYVDPKEDEVKRNELYLNWPTVKIMLLAIALLPFWFRLMQCFRRYQETKLVANLKNAGKYFTSLCV
jgi:hypothetical protein